MHQIALRHDSLLQRFKVLVVTFSLLRAPHRQPDVNGFSVGKNIGNQPPHNNQIPKTSSLISFPSHQRDSPIYPICAKAATEIQSRPASGLRPEARSAVCTTSYPAASNSRKIICAKSAASSTRRIFAIARIVPVSAECATVPSSIAQKCRAILTGLSQLSHPSERSQISTKTLALLVLRRKMC
jgi:hypothetical protein